jgi:hypothetical protein
MSTEQADKYTGYKVQSNYEASELSTIGINRLEIVLINPLE